MGQPVLAKDYHEFLVRQIAENDTSLSSTTPKPKVGLFINNLNPTPDTVLADLTPMTVPGYAAVEFSSTPSIYKDATTGEWTINCAGNFDYVCTGTPSITEVAYGWYLQVPGWSFGDDLLVAERFDVPVTFAAADTGHSFDVKFALPSDLFN